MAGQTAGISPLLPLLLLLVQELNRIRWRDYPTSGTLIDSVCTLVYVLAPSIKPATQGGNANMTSKAKTQAKPFHSSEFQAASARRPGVRRVDQPRGRGGRHDNPRSEEVGVEPPRCARPRCLRDEAGREARLAIHLPPRQRFSFELTRRGLDAGLEGSRWWEKWRSCESATEH